MRLIKSNEGEPYDAKNHFNSWSTKKIVPEQTSHRLNIVYSHFLPNGGASMSSSPLERAYYLLSGSLLIINKDHQECLLQPGDMIYIGPGEEREIKVLGNQTATMVVIMSKVD
jgi:quercetin dioxygenase-like cupin family protein